MISHNGFHSPHYMRKLSYSAALSLPPQGQNHMYPLSRVSEKVVFNVHSVLPQCIPNPISITSRTILPSIKWTHICPSCLQKCDKQSLSVGVGWYLFVPCKTMIYNNSQPVTTFCSSLSTYFKHHHRVSLETLAVDILCPASIFGQHVGLSERHSVCTFTCACMLYYVCQCCSSASHHSVIMEEQRAVSLLPHTGHKLKLHADLCPCHA